MEKQKSIKKTTIIQILKIIVKINSNGKSRKEVENRLVKSSMMINNLNRKSSIIRKKYISKIQWVLVKIGLNRFNMRMLYTRVISLSLLLIGIQIV